MPMQLSFRVLVAFFITASLMNISNYYFYSYYQQPIHAQTSNKVKLPRYMLQTLLFNMHSVCRVLTDQVFASCGRLVRHMLGRKLIFTYHLSRIKPVKADTVSTVSEVLTVADKTLQQITEDTLFIDQTYNYTDSSEKVFTAVPRCPQTPPKLGPIPSIPAVINRAAIENRFAEVLTGGVYAPLECEARFNVAVILPFRGLKEYLTPVIFFLHAFLIRQQLSYRIFVVGYEDNLVIFNRGELFNIGFIEAQRQRPKGWNCIVFQDVHLVPKDLRNLYRCGRRPRQLVTAVERTKKSPYVPTFGGAVALTPKQFKKVNGFSNHFWEPGFDYDDLYRRSSSLPKTPEQRKQRKLSYLSDGLSTIIYKLHDMKLESMYTHIQVTVHTIDRVNPNGNIPEKLYSSVMQHTERFF